MLYAVHSILIGPLCHFVRTVTLIYLFTSPGILVALVPFDSLFKEKVTLIFWSAISLGGWIILINQIILWQHWGVYWIFVVRLRLHCTADAGIKSNDRVNRIISAFCFSVSCHMAKGWCKCRVFYFRLHLWTDYYQDWKKYK